MNETGHPPAEQRPNVALPAEIDDVSETLYGPEPSLFRGVLAVVLRHRWSSLFVLVLVAALGTLYTLRATPTYTCHPALLQVVSDSYGISTISDAFERRTVTAEHFETLMLVVKSEAVLRAAYDDAAPVATKIAYEDFVDAVKPTRVDQAFLIRIAFESPHVELNPVAANAVARAFEETLRSQRAERTSTAATEFASRRDSVRDALAKAETSLAAFRTREQVSDVRAEKKKVDRLLEDAEERFDQQQVDFISVENEYGELRAAQEAGTVARITGIQDDPAFREVERTLRKVEDDRFLLLREWTENDPKIQLLDMQAGVLRQRRDDIIQIGSGKVERRYENAERALSRLTELRNARHDQQRELAGLLIELTNLEQERDRLRRDLDDLVAQSSDVQGAEVLEIAPLFVWEQARELHVPVSPRPVRDLTAIGLLALVMSMGTAFLFDQFHDAILSAEQVMRVTRLPVLGILPRASSADGVPALASLDKPRSEMAEAVRIIRTGLLFAADGRSPTRILVTSAEGGEGKTVLSANLAGALARSGDRTLLLDCDLRNPRQHKVFSLTNETGLSDLLMNANGNGRVAGTRPRESVAGLEVLTSGSPPPHPAELLASERMHALLDDSADTFDRIVLDSPPAGPVSDPAVLSRHVDAVVLVVELGTTSLRALRRAHDHLRQVRAPLIGVVLNGVRGTSGYYSYYSSHRYEYAGRGGRGSASA